MSLLERLHTAVKPKKTAWMFYGPAGIGKTSLAACFRAAPLSDGVVPKTVVIPDGFDDGINDLKRTGQCASDVSVLEPIQSKDDLWKVTQSLAEEAGLEREIGWAVFDGLSGVETHIRKFVTDKHFEGNPEKFMRYGAGFETMQPYIKEWAQMLNAICSRGIGVVLLAHSTTKKDKNPLGESFDKIVPQLHEKTYEAIRQWCPNIGFIGQDVLTDKEGLSVKAAAVDLRSIRFTPIPAVDAKNRYGITQPILMGGSGQEAFNNLMTAVKANTKGETK